MRGLFEREPAEEPKLRNLRVARVECRQPRERRVEIQEIDIARMAPHVGFIEIEPVPSSRPLLHLPGAGVIDQDAAHQLGRHREEVRTVLPHGAPLIDETEIGLVHEGRRLQRVVRALAPKAQGGAPPQLAVDGGHQFVARR